ncbi:MAG: sugar transferase [Tumebacillaceae bacterium]
MTNSRFTWYAFGKRVFDLVVASVGLLLLSPLMVVVALLVRWKLGSPVVFLQQRPGLHGTPFWIYKFRSMNDRRDADGNLLPDGERLTAFGKWLRRYSLDEMPQLLNVLRGDISLVGPSPLLMSYLPRYSEEQKRRHHVRPGITGWAQVNGRNSISWEEKFKLDVYYVDHASFGLDMKILWLTVIKVIRSEGISMQGEATMSEFRGSTDYEPVAQGVGK